MNWLFVAICHKQAVSDCQKIAIKKSKNRDVFAFIHLLFIFCCLHSKRI